MDNNKLKRFFSNYRFQTLTILFITLISRLPFLSPGFGIDSDSWRIIRAATAFDKTGVYEVSRFPGFPLIEIGLSPFASLEPQIVNSVSAVFSIIMIYFLWLLLNEFKVKYGFFLVIVVALSPLVFKNSVITMDYIWALAFMLGGMYLVLKNKLLLSGLMLGLAIGCRASSVLFLIPTLYILYYSYPKQIIKNSFKLTITTCLVGLICFLPVIIAYGSEFLQIYETSYPSFLQIIERLSVRVWDRLGILALVGVLVGLLISPKIFRSRRKHVKEEKLLLNVSLIIIVIYFLLFLYLPHEPEYFMPAVPFVIIIFNHFLKKKIFYIYGSLTILASFIAPCMDAPVCNGMVVNSFYTRQFNVNQYNNFLKDVDKINEKAVVIAGWYLPKVQYYSANYDVENITFVYLVSRQELDFYLNDGYAIYHLPGMDQYNKKVHGFMP